MHLPSRFLRPLLAMLALAAGGLAGGWLQQVPFGVLKDSIDRLSGLAAQMGLGWLWALAVPLIVSNAVLGGVGLEAMRGMRRLAGKSLLWMAGSTGLATLCGFAVVAVARPDVLRPARWPDPVVTPYLPIPGQWHLGWFGLVVLSLAFGFYRNQLEEGQGKLIMRLCKAVEGMVTPLLRWSQKYAWVFLFFLALYIGQHPNTYLEVAPPDPTRTPSTGGEIWLLLSAAPVFLLAWSILLWWRTRVNVWRRVGFLLPAMGVAAVGASPDTVGASPQAAFPLLMDAVRRQFGVSQRVASVTLPLGAVLGRDGQALVWTVAALYLWGPHGSSAMAMPLRVILLGAVFIGCGMSALSSGAWMFVQRFYVGSMTDHDLMPSLYLGLCVDVVGGVVSVFSQVCITILVARSEGEYWVPGPPPSDDELQGLKTSLELAED